VIYFIAYTSIQYKIRGSRLLCELVKDTNATSFGIMKRKGSTKETKAEKKQKTDKGKYVASSKHHDELEKLINGFSVTAFGLRPGDFCKGCNKNNTGDVLMQLADDSPVVGPQLHVLLGIEKHSDLKSLLTDRMAAIPMFNSMSRDERWKWLRDNAISTDADMADQKEPARLRVLQIGGKMRELDESTQRKILTQGKKGPRPF
jgi:hypothetical protein